MGLTFAAPLIAGALGLTSAPISAPAVVPVAAMSSSTAMVGALFPAGGDTNSTDHNCTASVVQSTGGNLILTAAHCVTGTGAGMVFVPGYAVGAQPYGAWQVTAAYATAGRLGDTPGDDDDVAILRVAPRRIDGRWRTVQQVTGGGKLASAPEAGSDVTVVGYAAGSKDSPLTCSTVVEETDDTPTFACGGFVGGTSGSPFLAEQSSGAMDVTGLIGGLDQGGCGDSTSYSPVFGNQVQVLLRRAESGAASDFLPHAGDDGC